MKQAHDPGRIDQHIPTELQRIGMRRSWPPPAHQLLRVRPPRSWTPDVPQTPSQHPVGAVQTPCFIDEDRSPDAGLLDVGARERTRLERHNGDADVEIDECLFVLLQLQQMPSARQSPEVAMKDEEQPMSPVVPETMDASLNVEERESGGDMANPTAHQRPPSPFPVESAAALVTSEPRYT